MHSTGNFLTSIRLSILQKKNNWPILQNVDVNSDDFFEFVKSKNLDLLVSVGGSQKFKKRILEAPKYGCINMHNSKLPKFRGMLPTFWALLNFENDSTSATTIFKMDEDLDSGPIILQEEFKLDEEESLDHLIKRTKRDGARLMVEAIKKYQSGEPKLYPNNPSEATYFSFPGKKDIQRFNEKGYRLL